MASLPLLQVEKIKYFECLLPASFDEYTFGVNGVFGFEKDYGDALLRVGSRGAFTVAGCHKHLQLMQTKLKKETSVCNSYSMSVQ